MVDVKRVKLPGVGVLHTFVTSDGGKVGVIAHRSGHSDLISFSDDEDGDATKVSLRLSDDEAHTLAELLGGTQITESLTALDQIPGLSIDWFTVDYEDHIAGQPLGSPADRGIAGLTVVAVVRGDSANPAPAPDFKVFPGDTLVVAGSPEKVAKAFAFFRTGELKAKAGVVDGPPGS
ncbi:MULTISPECIES: cation:proton antiporter regulatory subunit [Herbiconiux]|jgi:TrkA domain protein|uniref:TrkA domain protein n=2 Tax=Herbiconiux TaxID=881616 RepID=A0A852SNG2_9MICO|nr:MULTISPECIES: cation:proton antiporter regulatory subunit [Herbiconiux]MBF4571374.1 cation:proton antiporter regulatory subunit [Herbiconiux sp. VKM Ac-1786]MCS5714809.1 cation:proton antiporter regulatory subunit [Herbiconiux gentiana]NQX36175.1 cation:proton antiporter regulatory subunit [Herbiconiux sp. VKM Ac-2851]NYD70337.1 TrkA domain protein [Herbiconiux flava]GLK17091.1 potassium transporter TrkA [Herbiconiux flava]